MISLNCNVFSRSKRIWLSIVQTQTRFAVVRVLAYTLLGLGFGALLLNAEKFEVPWLAGSIAIVLVWRVLIEILG